MAGDGLLTPSELAGIERLVLRPDRRVAGDLAGPHRSRLRGRSLDVVDWREYQPGDDPRSIDHQAWARLDQVLVRVFEADVDLTLQLLVDTSGSMSVGGKLRHGGRVAAALGVAALVRNEIVSLSTLAEPEPRRFRGRAALGALLARIEGWEAAGPTPLAMRAHQLASHSRRSGMIVVVSDFLDPDVLVAVDRLAARREQVVAVAVVSEADEDPDTVGEVQLVDIETGHRVDVDVSPVVLADFRRRRAEARDALGSRLARHGGRLVVTRPGEDLLSQVLPALVAQGVLR